MVNMKTLKEKWAFTGINVEELIEEMYNLYHFYGHKYVTHFAIACVLDKYIDNKNVLIRMLMKADGYNGNLQAVYTIPIARDIDKLAIVNLLNEMGRFTFTEQKLVKRTNNEGKTIEQVILEGLTDMPATLKVDELNFINERKPIDISSFNRNGENVQSRKRYNSFKALITGYNTMFTRCTQMLEPEDIDELKARFGDDFKMSSSSQKASRVFNKLATFVGIDTQKDKSYTQRYAQYSDMINPNVNESMYVISLHPIDYMKMSIGTNWSSCHTSDPNNNEGIRIERGSSNYTGAYRGGTLSYMMDKVSMVTYTLPTSADRNHPEKERKILRNMMHYYKGTLLQGRVYPQSKDGCTDLYAVLRKFFEEKFTPCIGDGNYRNMWTAKRETYRCEGEVYTSTGAHYRDYNQYDEHYRGCCYTKLKDYNEGYEVVPIGTEGIDLHSGAEYTSTGLFSRCTYDTNDIAIPVE